MCQMLGISLSTTSIPQAKGRVERVFETIQDRLINEMRIAHIQNISEVNQFLEKFIPKFNNHFALHLKDIQNSYQKLEKSTDINHLLCRHDIRTINAGHAIQYHHYKYHLVDKEGNIQYIPPKSKVMIIETFDDQLFANYYDHLYHLQKILCHDPYFKELDVVLPQSITRVIHNPTNDSSLKRGIIQAISSKIDMG